MSSTVKVSIPFVPPHGAWCMVAMCRVQQWAGALRRWHPAFRSTCEKFADNSSCVDGIIAVEDLLMWRDIKKSAIAFGGITLGFAVIHWGTQGLKPLPTLLRLLAYAALIAVAWATVAGFVGR